MSSPPINPDGAVGVDAKSSRNEGRSQSSAASRQATLLVCGLLFLLVAVAFGKTTSYDFVNFDDRVCICDNAHVTGGLSLKEIGWALTNRDASTWAPLCWVSHMVDCQIYGLGAGGHHLTNVLLHAITAILLFLLLKSMTGHRWPSLLAAAIFAVHPLRVESVAWVTERRDVLSGVFFMLTLWAYSNYARGQQQACKLTSCARYLAVLLCFALGLMAKPTLVALPLILPLLDYWPLERLDSVSRANKRRWLWLVLEKLPLVALAAASCVLTVWAEATALGPNEQFPFPWRVGNAAISYVSYLGHFFYPLGLSVAYPRAELHLPIAEVVAASLLLVAISAAVVLWRQRHQYLLVGWLWYLVMMLPVIGLVQFGVQAEADRFTYLPQIGVGIAVAWALAAACRRPMAPMYRLGVIAGAVLAILVLTVLARRQAASWSDSETLWRHALARNPRNRVARDVYAAFLEDQRRCPEALEQHRTIVSLYPDNAEAENNLGLMLSGRGRSEEAISHYRAALRLKPELAETENNWGYELAKRGQHQEAILHYLRALVTNPKFAQARYNLGNALAARDRLDEAIVQYRKTLALKPDMAEAHGNLGNALSGKNRLEDAIASYRRALALKPDNAKTRNNLGVALAGLNRLDEAIAEYRRALQVQLYFTDAYFNLATALQRQGKLEEAIANYEFALLLKPGDEELGSALRRAKQRSGHGDPPARDAAAK
ncbi:MAG: tetratricopeptide repeat protein [Planctomycetaceae bacterium]|nr:tetratricopeptide repeat protein [Planctomycetaceae bacterium]